MLAFTPMGATFLMSYPGPGWKIQGGENFRSKEKSETNPKRAFREWIKLCEAISSAGGRILVMPPVEGLTGMMYTANSGALFKQGDSWQFVISKMSVAHRQPERPQIKKFLDDAGI